MIFKLNSCIQKMVTTHMKKFNQIKLRFSPYQTFILLFVKVFLSSIHKKFVIVQAIEKNYHCQLCLNKTKVFFCFLVLLSVRGFCLAPNTL
uniref:Uncharacterized protein n=1 Tax=Arundo donax TaxID=35708 RepID=A0A0A9DCC3_ARUDO